MCVCVFDCKSPISMKVTMRLLSEGADLTLAQDLKTEFRLCQRFVRDSDFYEGVRAGRDAIVCFTTSASLFEHLLLIRTKI